MSSVLNKARAMWNTEISRKIENKEWKFPIDVSEIKKNHEVLFLAVSKRHRRILGIYDLASARLLSVSRNGPVLKVNRTMK